MSRKSRHILVIFLAAAFAATAPAVLLYTSGYSYSWKKHKVEKTGSFHTETRPRGATVLIDGDPTRRTTPETVTRMLPEDYAIEIRKDGYLPWAKKLRIESGKTTFAKEIVLLPDVLPRLETAIGGEPAAWAPDGKRAGLIDKGEAWTEILVHDLRTDDTTVLSRLAGSPVDGLALEWSRDSGTLAVTGRDAETGEPMVFLYAGDTRDPALFAVHESVPLVSVSVGWDGAGRALLLTDDGVSAVDPRTTAVAPLFAAHGIVDVAYGNGEYWTVRAASSGPVLERRGPDGKDLVEVAALPKGDHRFVHVGAAVVLIDARGTFGTVIDPETGESSQVPPYFAAVTEHPDGTGQLLLCGEFELALLPDGASLPNVITRIGDSISSCAWHPSGNYVFYAAGGKVLAVELDERDRRNVYELARFDAAGPIAADPESGMLRFVGTVGNQRGIFERPF